MQGQSTSLNGSEEHKTTVVEFNQEHTEAIVLETQYSKDCMHTCQHGSEREHITQSGYPHGLEFCMPVK